jgi:hypothetical protein
MPIRRRRATRLTGRFADDMLSLVNALRHPALTSPPPIASIRGVLLLARRVLLSGMLTGATKE